MEANNYLALILWHKGPRFVIARRPQADVAISQYPTRSQESHRRKRNCLPEIATAPLGPRNDKLEGLAPQNACRKDCQPARRSLSAATFFSRAAALYNERRYRRNR